MSRTTRTLAGAALSDLTLDLFKLSNRMVASGDRLVAQLGLTSARWQVLGSIVAAANPQPVAWLARDMGASRQNIQRIVNDLEKDGQVTFRPNPHHRRSQLVILTAKGRQTFDAAMRLQMPWINALAKGLEVLELKITHRVIANLHKKLEREEDSGGYG